MNPKRNIIAAMATVAALTAAAADTAQFPGGDAALQEYIVSNMKYPQPAAERGIEGVVSVQCVIMPDGGVGTIKIVRMVDPDLEAEAIRLVKNMPAWTPADKGGTPVESTVTIPVKFSLPDE